MPSSFSSERSAASLKCGKWREKGVVRTSATAVIPDARSSDRKCSYEWVECPMVKTVRSFTFLFLQNAVDHQVASIWLSFEISREPDSHVNCSPIWKQGGRFCNTAFPPCLLVDMARYGELIACCAIVKNGDKLTKWLRERNVSFAHLHCGQ